MSPEEVIDAMYSAVFAGDIDTALRYCADDAVWHGITPAPVTGDHSMRSYLTELLPAAMDEMDAYAITAVERDTFDELVISRLRSTHGSGLMVFRVVDDTITDLWVLNAKGRDTTGYF